MIDPLMGEDAWCYWVISVGALLSFIGLIATCICSCRRNENKTEFLGLAGMVTLKHTENEGFNGLPAVDVPQIITQDVADSAKRATTANRSLPDIPKDKSGDRRNESGGAESQDIYESTEVTGDQSELYATVQDKGEWKGSGDGQREERGESLSRKSAINEDHDAHYQYARFSSSSPNKDEHPYAQLKNVEKMEVSQPRDRTNTGQSTDNDKPSTSVNQAVGNPVAPPRARRSSSHNSLHVADAVGNIQAANAISGGVQANQDLPYMTPPLLTPFPYTVQSQRNINSSSSSSPQQHFSGDSQDSKGYTSISVREPLANIIAQTKAVSQQHQTIRPLVDSHYTTVSDDSDEMYAAIDEQDKVYTSGSETYAQIQPANLETTRATRTARTTQNDHVQVHGQSSTRSEETHYPVPQPPSVDSLRHVAHAHSRQASSSSATSSIVIPGSPKPEKRQANSPLPPPPPPPPSPPPSPSTTEQPTTTMNGVLDVYAFVDKKCKGEDRGKTAVGKSNLEDMYAKVMKKKKDEHAEERMNPAQGLIGEMSVCLLKNPTESRISSWSSHDSAEIKRDIELSRHNGNYDGSIEPFEPVFDVSKDLGDLVSSEHGYEAVNSLSRENGGHASSRAVSISEPDYEMLIPQGCSSGTSKGSKKNLEPRLENQGNSVSLKHRQVSNASSEDPGYERVRLNSRVRELDQDTDSEPNYESMPHDVGEPNYASVCRPGDSDTDPNYESVGHADPNYESVKYMSLVRNEEPPYEQVINRKTADDYERVNARLRDSDYEKILRNHPEERRSNGDTDDEQYIQV